MHGQYEINPHREPVRFLSSEYFSHEGRVFNNALNTFYLLLYGIRYMAKDHSYKERGNLLQPLHGPGQVRSGQSI